MRRLKTVVLGTLLLVGCQGASPGTPPSARITSPVSGQSVSGAATITVETTGEVARVDAYLRPSGSSETGVTIGGASAAPFQIGWNTLNFPNATSFELYAEATSGNGAKGKSAPVNVKVSHAGTPSLNYLVAISYPAGGLAASSLQGGGRPKIDATQVQPPAQQRTPSVPLTASTLSTLASSARNNDLEWGWTPVDGADGYGVFLSSSSVAGPYTRQVSQRAGGVGEQGFAVTVKGQPGDQYYGSVSAITGSAESGLSNADAAIILPEPQLASPANGQRVGDGRPTLTWTPTAGAVGYLYYLYAQNPETVNNPKAVWTNYPNTSEQLAAVYPASSPALTSGTYYWRVAAVNFDSRGKADSFSFTSVRSFQVP